MSFNPGSRGRGGGRDSDRSGQSAGHHGGRGGHERSRDGRSGHGDDRGNFGGGHADLVDSPPQEPFKPKARPNPVDALTQELKRLGAEAVQRAAVTEPNSTEESDKDRWAKASLTQTASLGNVRRNLSVLANFFKIELPKDSNDIRLRKYRIELGKIDGREVTNRATRRSLIESMFKQQPPTTKLWTSDFHSYVVSHGRLWPFNSTNWNDSDDSIVSSYKVSHLRPVHPHQDKKDGIMKTTLWDKGRINMGSLLKYLQGNIEPASYLVDNDLRALNILSWKSINDSDVFEGGRAGKKFYPSLFGDTTPTENGYYQLATGAYTSFRPVKGALLLNINPATSAFYPNVNLLEYIWTRWRRNNILPGTPAHHELKGLKIENMKNVKFKKEGEEEETSVWDHMNTRYPQEQFDAEAVCVNCGNLKNPKWYPVDKLTLAKWQSVRGLVDSSCTQDMLAMAVRVPGENKRQIQNRAFSPLGVKRYGESYLGEGWSTGFEEFYSKFKLGINPELLVVQARLLPPPTLGFADDKELKINNAAWNLADSPFRTVAVPEPVLRVVMVGGSKTFNKKSIEAIEAFEKELKEQLNLYRIEASWEGQIKLATLPDLGGPIPNRRQFISNLDQAFVEAGGSLNPSPKNVVLLVLWEKNIPIYSDIKWWGDCHRGVRTTCITMKAVKKRGGGGGPDRMLLGNVCMKINFKLGGTDHCLVENEQQVYWAGAKEGTMIVGADVTHSGRGIDPNCPSLAGIVATSSRMAMTYTAEARLQSNNTESIEDLAGMIKSRMLFYYERNQRKFPAHILFYRDGVSESQYGMVKLDELPRIIRGCELAMQEKNSSSERPLITLLVVGKRHHIRFYPRNSNSNEKQNTPPGLVVDSDVVNPTYSNFYLQSHASPLGTAKPAHYVVIENESKYNLERLEQITNRLCYYTGSRATKALSVCTPARYADILCDRLRCYMKPALDGALTSSSDVSLYIRNQNVWNVSQTDGRQNPWSDSLRDIMFYL